jgi:protein-disulfide isomerase
MKNLSIPIAIIIAGAIIAGAIFFSRTPVDSNLANDKQAENSQEEAFEDVKVITENDHVLGNPDAKIAIIEYSDTECPYCKKFHQTMKQVMDEYGKNGEVKWVYRHFPLDNIHMKARTEAGAAECAGGLGGNEKFWEFLDSLYEITPSNDGLDLAELPKIAEAIGLNKSEFEECLTENRYAEKVESDLQGGVSAGIQGTPFSLIVNEKGEFLTVEGAYPYSSVKSSIDQLLQ